MVFAKLKKCRLEPRRIKLRQRKRRVPPFHLVNQDFAIRKVVQPVAMINVQVRKDNPADTSRRAIKSGELGAYLVFIFYMKLEEMSVQPS
jgi:hypothetical protein